MFHTRTAIACCTLAIVSTANAGFTFTATDQGLISGYQVYLIRAINDGIGTGTELDGYDLTFHLNPATTTAHFSVLDSDFDGTPDTADLVNTGNPNAGFMRVGAFGTTSIVATTPALGPAQPNPWDSINTWSVAAISTGSENATGNGAVIARLFTSGIHGGGNISGFIGGNEGPAVPVDFTFGVVNGDTTPPAVMVNPNVVSMDFTTQTSFGPVLVTATDNVGVISLTPGTIPAQIADNITITGSSTGPLEINGSGFDMSDFGTYTIDFTALDAAGNQGVATLTINFPIPEPTTLGLLSGLTILVLRRR